MSTLDSPLEALALSYLSYGLLTVVNNIWTWVAVITAAVSFWRIKASSSSSIAAITSEHPRGKIPDGSSPVMIISSPVDRVAAEPAEVPEPASTSGEPAVMTSSCKMKTFGELEREGSTKGKFTLFYDNEDDDDHGDWSGGDNGNGDGGGGVVGEGWWDRWERVMRMRMGDEEWYSYQDLTVINGSVVRLWDGCRRRNAIPLELVGGVTW